MAYLLRQAAPTRPAEEMSRLDQYLVSLKRALRKRATCLGRYKTS